MASVKEEPVDRLAQYRIAVGTMHLTIGPAGVGKSTFILTKAAALTRGGDYPGGPKFARSGNLAILAAEDGRADTTKPRFVAAGGDPNLAFFLKTRIVTKDQTGRTVILPAVFQDLDYWARFFDLWKRLLLIADPIQAFMGRGVKDRRNTEVQAVLEPFVELLREKGIPLGRPGRPPLAPATEVIKDAWLRLSHLERAEFMVWASIAIQKNRLETS
jgi:hypothetical protein